MKVNQIKPTFSQNPVDRMDHKRADIHTARNATQYWPKQRYLLLWQNHVLLDTTSNDYLFNPQQLPTKLIENSQWVYLGQLDGLDYFAMSLSEDEAKTYKAVPLRAFVLEQMASEKWFGLFAQANSLLSWHQSHQFCARCGSKSLSANGGWRRDCPDCKAEHFPRTDPVVIMLVTHGNKCLLGRGHNFGQKRFSCLAGFMEPGETIAQASRRELFEEAGVTGGEVTFLFDQPWPFPSNLMIGVHVEALTTELSVDTNELAEAMWVTKEEIKAALAGDTQLEFEVPPSVAIARNLLQWYIDR